jgi:hypothetical protein
MDLRFFEEATFGINVGDPTPTGVWTPIPHMSESLETNQASVASQQSKSTRQRTAVSRVDQQTAGDIPTELLFGEHDKLYEYFLQSATPAAQPADFTPAGSTAPDKFTGTGIDGAVAIGDWVRSDGSEAGLYKVIDDGTTDEITVEGPTLTGGGSGLTLEISRVMTEGTTFKTITIEKAFTDLASEFAIFTGQAVQGLSLAGARGDILTSTFSFLGANEVSKAATSSTSIGAELGNEPITSMNALSSVRDNGVPYAVQSLGFEAQNALRPQGDMFSLPLSGIGNGSFTVTGSHVAFFRTKAMLDNFLNFVTRSLAYVLEDPDGNAFIFDWPHVKYTGGRRVGGGIDTDIFAEMTWEAFADTKSTATDPNTQMRIAWIA